MATAVQEINGAAKRAEVVKLRLAGHTNEAIAQQAGITESGVRYHVKTWIESIQPPAERANELREVWGGRLELAHEKLWPLVEEGDQRAIETMLKIQAQFSRLFGLDLQPSMMLGVVTAEGMAALFGLDAGEPVIEGTATELAPGEGA